MWMRKTNPSEIKMYRCGGEKKRRDNHVSERVVWFPTPLQRPTGPLVSKKIQIPIFLFCPLWICTLYSAPSLYRLCKIIWLYLVKRYETMFLPHFKKPFVWFNVECACPFPPKINYITLLPISLISPKCSMCHWFSSFLFLNIVQKLRAAVVAK